MAIDGVQGAWMLAADVAEAAAAEPRGLVRLLPAFDQHVVTLPRDVDAVLAAERRERVYRPQGWLSPVVVVDGAIVGALSHERRGGGLAVEVQLFGRAGRALRAGIAAEADRLAACLGLEAGKPAIAVG